MKIKYAISIWGSTYYLTLLFNGEELFLFKFSLSLDKSYNTVFNRQFLNQYSFNSWSTFGIGVAILDHDQVIILFNFLRKVKVTLDKMSRLYLSSLNLADSVNTELTHVLKFR